MGDDVQKEQKIGRKKKTSRRILRKRPCGRNRPSRLSCFCSCERKVSRQRCFCAQSISGFYLVSSKTPRRAVSVRVWHFLSEELRYDFVWFVTKGTLVGKRLKNLVVSRFFFFFCCREERNTRLKKSSDSGNFHVFMQLPTSFQIFRPRCLNCPPREKYRF